jgi:glutamate/tyrosine decarboxylase-like PLP-dependent enzyme
MADLPDLLATAAGVAAAYRASLASAPVAVPVDRAALEAGFGALPDGPSDPAEVLAALATAAAPGLVQTAGPRFYGFVTGGSLDAAVAAEVLAAGWDQCAFNGVLSPAALAAEAVAGAWLKDLLGLPEGASVGFVTGGQAANTVGIAAGRLAVLERAGWDLDRDGLYGAPRVRVLAGVERHATVDRTLRLLGLGLSSIEEVAADANGALDVADLARVLRSGSGPSIVVLQAGNVNTGACDDLRGACAVAKEHGAWVHVDGAFGLWAAATPARRHLVDGVELADSWGCDGHKWLNLPYDSGFAICADPDVHARAVSYTAAYLTGSGTSRGGADYTLESSRRARGFAAWAGLRQLGRSGVADLVERNCQQAERFARGLVDGGAEVVNDVVLNQVLASFGSDARNDAVVAGVQADGTCWLGATTWRGRRLLRAAMSNATTTDDDIDRSVEAVLRVARDVTG